MLNCHSTGTPSILFQKPCIYQHVGILHQIKTYLNHFLTTCRLDPANYQTYFQETGHTCYLFSPFSLPHRHTCYHSSSGHATCLIACTSTTIHNHDFFNSIESDQSHWFSFHVNPWKYVSPTPMSRIPSYGPTQTWSIDTDTDVRHDADK